MPRRPAAHRGQQAPGAPARGAHHLFQESLAIELWERVRDLPTGLPLGWGPAPEPVAWSQTSLIWRRQVTGTLMDYDIAVCASWDGAAGVAERIAASDAYLDSLVDHRIGPGWQLADDVVSRLRGFGDFSLTVLFTGGRFPRRREPADEVLAMRRGPMAAGVENDHLASLGRELMRSVGSPVPEPPIREPDENAVDAEDDANA